MGQGRQISPFNIAVTAVFTALVCIATMMISTYVPATEGFFNVGESMVYLAAILFGPAVGAFAGGVGSMMADLLLGYAVFAPATLVVKACEGAIVGVLAKKTPKFGSATSWRFLTLILGVAVGSYIWWVGTSYYSGEMYLTLGLGEMLLNIPTLFWVLMGALVAILLIALGFITDPEFGWTVFSVLIGGLVMVSGYFIYEQFFMGVAAIAEVPINVGQMTIGAAVALPVANIVKRALPNIFK